jgi:hypothetical protein
MDQQVVDELGEIYANLRTLVNKLKEGESKKQLKAALIAIEDVLFRDGY